MHKRYIIAAYRFGFGALGLAALTTQFVFNAQNIPNYNPVNFFSFFTIESNILATLILISAGFGAVYGKRHDTFAFWRGAATAYMVITSIIYVLLLSGLEDLLQTPIPWVNTVLHYALPVVVLADWLIDPPERHISFKRALAWLVFPLTYAAYSIIRGHFVNWYPYPFLNPTEQGYGGVAGTSLLIMLASLLIIWLVSWMTRFSKAAKLHAG